MTLIAAFRLHEVPVLLGDLLITAGARANVSSFLPTAPQAAARLPDQIGARIAGARKKVHIIGPSLAVAWAGSQLAASRVVEKLHTAFSSTRASRESLFGVLSEIRSFEDELFSLNLIGWLVDPIPLCFRWNSMWPKEIFIADEHFDGSGEEMFNELRHEQYHASGFGPGIATREEAAVFSLLAKASQLLDKEIVTGGTLLHRFGYSYEIAFFDGGIFRYVDEVTYLTWEISSQSSSGSYRYRLGPTLVKYRNMGEFSVVQTTELKDGKALTSHVDLIAPVHDNLPGLDPQSLGRQSLQSAYYCNFIHYFIAPTTAVRGSFVTHTSDNTLMGHEIRGGKDFFWLTMRQINDAIGLGSEAPSSPADGQ